MIGGFRSGSVGACRGFPEEVPDPLPAVDALCHRFAFELNFGLAGDSAILDWAAGLPAYVGMAFFREVLLGLGTDELQRRERSGFGPPRSGRRRVRVVSWFADPDPS